MKQLTFIVGGGRCGKSRHAVTLAHAYPGNRVFIATAEALDEEMKARIAAHQKERKGAFFTIEEPLDLAEALLNLPQDTRVVIIDCLTVWLGNLMHHYGTGDAINDAITRFINALEKTGCDVIAVANEVGMGIIPENEMARQFRDLAGRLNQQVAEAANNVILMVSGIAMAIKEEM